MLAVVSAAGIGFAASLLGDTGDTVGTMGHPVRADTRPDSLHLTNQGVPVMTDGVRIVLTVDDEVWDVETKALQRPLGVAWGHGERLCIVGPAADCLLNQGQKVTADVVMASEPAGSFLWRLDRGET